MANCKYCKKRIIWKQVELQRPRKIIQEIEGKLQLVYGQVGWKPHNLDLTIHRCR
jgi:hypothetical protein